jgi:hypothetical protein
MTTANGTVLHRNEQAVLGSMVRDNGCIPAVLRVLAADSFRESAHRAIFTAVRTLHLARSPVDLDLLASALQRAGAIDDVGGYAYLGELWDAAPTAANVEYYAREVGDAATRRRVLRDAQQTVEQARRPTGSVQELLEAAARRFRLSPEPGAGAGFVWAPVDAAAFARTDYSPEWLVKGLLVRGQPAVAGGARKMMKTSALADMVVRLASGTPFLGHFPVPRPVRVAFLSAESGPFTLQETHARVCAARGVRLADLKENLVLQFTLPQFGSGADLAELRDGLRRDSVGVIVLDPSYLAMTAGQGPGGARAENLFDMGPLLLGVARACLTAGTTPVLAHHSRKGTAASLEPLDLDDLAYAGVAEFARQWLLLSRRERYEPGTGRHKLWLTVGGSMGHGGLWSVDIDEGTIRDDFAGRKWDVTVRTATEARQSAREERDRARAEEQRARDREDDAALLGALDGLDPAGQGAGWNQVQDLSRLSDARMLRATQRLITQGVLEGRHVMVNVGVGLKTQRPVRGLRRTPEEGSP